MNYLFDSSAIFRLIRDNNIDLLVGGYTIKLAQYEIGNIFWKEARLHKHISEQEAKHLLSDAYTAISAIEVREIANAQQVLELALKLGTSFYDASYLYEAVQLKVPFITEDEKLKQKVEGSIKTMLVDEILR
ncbi:type II toxin-antitoxin system VapC family toxin [Candidatus Marsarchaeota archaeon]|nr:type II toxin-antitoxin system VapC family toxin [Candidatus Marsarchaeota archaeon]